MPETFFSIKRSMLEEFSGVTTSENPSLGWEFGLSKNIISQDGTGISEPSAPSYSRVVIPKDTLHWSEPENGTLINTSIIEFEIATEDWGLMLSAFLLDVETNKVWYYQTLTPSIEVLSGTKITFNGGDLVFGRLVE